jgi:hypothetical protein
MLLHVTRRNGSEYQVAYHGFEGVAPAQREAETVNPGKMIPPIQQVFSPPPPEYVTVKTLGTSNPKQGTGGKMIPDPLDDDDDDGGGQQLQKGIVTR